MITPREIRNFPSLHDHPNPELPNDKFFYRPYLGDNQTIIILDLLDRLNPNSCLEWGAGFSTVFFPRFIPKARWFSIEHHPYFAKNLKPFVPCNVDFHEEPIWERYIDLGFDFQKRVGFVDFVFVDGERREECIQAAAKILRTGGVLLRHDAGSEDVPILVNGKDVRELYRQHGIIEGMWWAIL